MKKNRGFLKSLLSVALLAILLFSAVSCGEKDMPADDYLSIARSQYYGLTLNMVDAYASIYKEHTYEEMDEYIEYLRLSLRESDYPTAQVKSDPIGYGDDVHLYILNATCEGDAAIGAHFINAYEKLSAITIGTKVFGEAFDEAIIGQKPIDTTFNKITKGTPNGDSVLYVTYTGPDGKKVETERLVLAEQDEAFVSALLAGFKNFNVPFSFSYTPATEDETPEALEYKDFTVHYIASEKSTTITAQLPDDYFALRYGEDDKLTKYDGKEVAFEVIIMYFNDYTVPELDVTFFTETIKDTVPFTTDETDFDVVLEEFKQFAVPYLNEQVQKQLDEEAKNTAWTQIFESTEVISYPKEALQEAYSVAYQKWYALWQANASQFETPDDYIYAYVYNMLYQMYGNNAQYYIQYYPTTLSAYADNEAKNEIKQKLIVSYIFDKERMELTEAEKEEAYEEYLADILADNPDSTEEDIVEELGKDKMLAYAEENYAKYNKMMAFVLENATRDYGLDDEK